MPSFWLSRRFFTAFAAFLGFVNLYALRINLSVAIVCMTNHTAVDPHPHNVDGPFKWSKNTQGLVLSSFFYGYIFTQLPGGLMSEKFGAKNVFGGFMFVAAICTLVSPIAAKQGYIGLIVCRIILGLAEGVSYPSMHAMWSKWAPVYERSKLAGFNYAGSQIGIVLTFPLSAYLCSELSWESVFYVFGSFGIAWCVMWQLCVSSTPGEDKWIGNDELAYITKSLEDQGESEKTKISKMPWLDMLKSLPLWAIIVAEMSANYGTYFMMTSLPFYMEEVLDFDIKSNGLYSALPYVAYFAGINFSTSLGDYIRQRQYLSTTIIRKGMTALALCGQAVFLISAAYCECGKETLAVVFIVIAQGISGFQYSGCAVNHIDIAPRFAGTLQGITNTSNTIGGILVPLLVAALTPNGTRDEWIIVFWIAFGVLFFGASFFIIFGTGNLQPWNSSRPNTTVDQKHESFNTLQSSQF